MFNRQNYQVQRLYGSVVGVLFHGSLGTLGALFALALIALFPQAVFAGFSQNDVTSPGGFLSSYAGEGGHEVPGADHAPQFVVFNIAENPFAGSGTASGSESYANTGATYTNSNSGTAGLGLIQFSATSDAMQNFTTSTPSTSLANGGWVDEVTITSPTANGQAATWLFHVNVKGEMAVAGPIGGEPSILVAPYVDNTTLNSSIAGFDIGGSKPLSTGFQVTQWDLVGDGFGNPANRSINDTVTFAAEIVIGTPFDLGVFALGVVNSRSSNSVDHIGETNTGELSMGEVSWGGSSQLLVGGSPVTDFSIASVSGTNWVQPIPEPGTLLLSGALLIPLLSSRRRAISDLGGAA